VLFVIDQPVPADLQNKAGRGSLNALPSYEDKIHAATAHMLSSTRSDFRNIERIAKNFSRDLNGQSRKRKTEVLTSE
jgi:hypothetical protein